MVDEYKHRLVFSERHGSENPGMENRRETCPFHIYLPGSVEEKRLAIGSCDHPLIQEGAIECHYGKSESRVPQECPLVTKALTIKLETAKVE